MERKAGLGTIMIAASDASTVSALNATALPAVSIVSATEAAIASGRRASTPGVEGGAEPHDQEQRVVDAQGEGEHQREVESPDGDGHELGRDDQGAAATSSPAMVNSRGSPAATRLPKAMTKMMIVTGHDSISERSMAERLALLKFAHRALSPVRVTLTPGDDKAESFGAASRRLSPSCLSSRPIPR